MENCREQQPLLVVFYEPVPSGVKYIQREGRTGRKSKGEAVILATEDTHDIPYLKVSEKRRKRMRQAVKGLNSELEPLERKGPEPEKNPIPRELIREAEKYTPPEKEKPAPEAEIGVEKRPKPEELAEDKAEELEKKRQKEFRRRERYTAERALEKILSSGKSGISTEKLEKTLQNEGSTEGIAKAAVERLKREDQVREKDGKLLSKGAARVEKGAHPGSEVHEFFIEKVRRGNANVKVDGKWRAVLTPEDYEGPRNLIKKGKRFKGAADLYHEDGKFRAWIKDVVGK
ncbi:hypothetical protein AKJ37_05535 [candidate division MSBL1 archaeon SCGC-AAA259I09]|uniref:Helicase C-terminal domain-containing protein n=1 Tax=candidate division MSBL1 archaeon SCGC-AAA259I09 TaxID=1698267 RepID=A0A133UQ11_9EURY|nr:hypothetical protein AKJ37_05535 [candidate division MSBL1 archaeon SCGC-AAA259I09]